MKTKELIYGFMMSVVAIAMLAATAGCTRNNGDIGDWFGTWRVESITVDGEPDGAYAPPYMIWKFQSSIIQIMVPDDAEHSAPSATGSWHEESGKLYLDFTWDLGTPGDISHLPQKCELTILKLSGSKIELQYNSPDGKTYIYYLKKWG